MNEVHLTCMSSHVVNPIPKPLQYNTHSVVGNCDSLNPVPCIYSLTLVFIRNHDYFLHLYLDPEAITIILIQDLTL